MSANEHASKKQKGVGKNRTGQFARKGGYMSCIEAPTKYKPSEKTVQVRASTSALPQTQSSGSSIPSEYKLSKQAEKNSRKVRLSLFYAINAITHLFT